MPGTLHQYAIQTHARAILGDGMQTKGMKAALRKIISDELIPICDDDLANQGGYESLQEMLSHKKYKTIRELADSMVEDQLDLARIRVIPDAFAITRVETDYGYGFQGKYVYQINVCEVDGTSDLNSKLTQWIDFGFEVDCSDYFHLSLKILPIHGQLIGEYDEEDFAQLWLERTLKQIVK